MHTQRGVMQRKNLVLSVDMIERAEATAKTLNLGFSQLVREAVQQFVERVEKEAAEKELVEACRKYKQFNEKFSSEWAKFETRTA